MKTYTLFLDVIIMSLLLLAVQFNLSDNTITDVATGRRGTIHMMVISWQTLFFLASFCVLLRYIARNVRC
ncbi:MAG: hypothetical protein H0X41_00495 [Chitinophagaceae bacterium]|nr:hypothetical protein [Chitinophagaceae bacterium]